MDKTITTRNLHEFSEQEVFDYIVNHLLTQNKRSVVKGVCKYHSLDGLKCAAGVLISESEYSTSMEGKSWYFLTEDAFKQTLYRGLITDLQFIHDNHDPMYWPKELRDLAINRRLSFNH